MKILKTSDITDAASMPLKSGSLEFLQQEHRETTVAIVTGLLGYTPDPVKGYKLFGVSISSVGSIYTITDGYIYFNGEIFKVNGSTFSLGGGEQIWGNISNIAYTAADPVMFGDGVERNVHLDRQISFVNGTSGDLLWTNTLTTGVWLTGDLKEIDCNNAYITANFDGTGLGINERIGWAICNGNNGTQNRNGRVSVQYDPTNYSTMGAVAGSKDAVVVQHSHSYGGNLLKAGGSAVGIKTDTDAYFDYPDHTEDTGVSGTDKNMQPYIVTLFIQKI